MARRKFSKPTEYEKLRAVWYKKLSEEGFKDIEQDEDHLKVWSVGFFKKQPKEIWEAKQAYYHMTDRFLNEFQFANELEKVIWEYHANGLGCRAIASILKKLKLVKKTNRTTVWLTIKRLKAAMRFMYVTDAKET